MFLLKASTANLKTKINEEKKQKKLVKKEIKHITEQIKEAIEKGRYSYSYYFAENKKLGRALKEGITRHFTKLGYEVTVTTHKEYNLYCDLYITISWSDQALAKTIIDEFIQ